MQPMTRDQGCLWPSPGDDDRDEHSHSVSPSPPPQIFYLINKNDPKRDPNVRNVLATLV